MTPIVSDLQYNPVNDNNTDGRCPIEVTVRILQMLNPKP